MCARHFRFLLFTMKMHTCVCARAHRYPRSQTTTMNMHAHMVITVSMLGLQDIISDKDLEILLNRRGDKAVTKAGKGWEVVDPETGGFLK